MVRYEVLRGALQLGEEVAPLSITLPVRRVPPSGLCVAAVGSGAPLQAVSVQVGDGQPLFEGVPAAAAANGRINFTHEFVSLEGVQAGGSELRITPICAAAGSLGNELAVILQYNE